MKLMGMWLAFTIISLMLFYIGILVWSKTIIFIGLSGMILGSVCVLSTLLIMFIKGRNI